ncbi:MAG: GAF domain-containing protein, partial [Acidobacteria bacterium]|nr:GAF domain-containing protein [Acidobacteriota bacterium]
MHTHGALSRPVDPDPSPDAMAIVCGLTRTLSGAKGVDDIYGAALDALERALGSTRSAILLFDEDGVMRFKASRGLSGEYRQAVEGHSPWRPGAIEPAPLVVEDTEVDPNLLEYRDVFRREGIRTLGFIPLVAGGRVIGKFMLYHAEPHRLAAAELSVARALGALIGFALERHRSGTDRKQAADELPRALDGHDIRIRLTTLAEASPALLSSLHLAEVLPAVLDLAARVVKADAYAIWRFEASAWRIVESRGLSDAFTRTVVEAGTTPWMPFDTPQAIENVETHSLLANRREPLRAEGIAAMLTTPLRIGGTNSGTLVC